jgi:hypothetical protein
MDLIDRYVVEVARHLPAKNAEDVAAELRSLLTDAFEARAARTATAGPGTRSSSRWPWVCS